MTKFLHLDQNNNQILLNNHNFKINNITELKQNNKNKDLKHIKKGDYFLEIKINETEYLNAYITKQKYNEFINKSSLKLIDNKKYLNFITNTTDTGLTFLELLLGDSKKSNNDILLSDILNYNIIDLFIVDKTKNSIVNEFDYNLYFNDLNCYIKSDELLNIQKELINLGILFLFKRDKIIIGYKAFFFDIKKLSKIIFDRVIIKIYDDNLSEIFMEINDLHEITNFYIIKEIIDI